MLEKWGEIYRESGVFVAQFQVFYSDKRINISVFVYNVQALKTFVCLVKLVNCSMIKEDLFYPKFHLYFNKTVSIFFYINDLIENVLKCNKKL